MIAWFDDMLPGYVAALGLMEIAVARAREDMKRERDPSRRAAKRARYRELCEVRLELKNTVKYLKNYGSVAYIGSKSWNKVTDCECICEDGKYGKCWHMGGHQIAAGGSEAPGGSGD